VELGAPNSIRDKICVTSVIEVALYLLAKSPDYSGVKGPTQKASFSVAAPTLTCLSNNVGLPGLAARPERPRVSVGENA
jgi:hypothetical protein